MFNKFRKCSGVAMISIFGLMMSAIGCSQQQKPKATEHGFKTTRVVATRMMSDMMGLNVKFEYPLNGYDSDRVDISDWLEEHGGYIMQGGGSPYAPSHVSFPDVKDVDSLNKKLLEVLPGLDLFMSKLNDDVYMNRFRASHKRWDRAHKPQWPDTTPPDQSDPHWEFNNNMNVNGTPYRKVEVSPGKWQWQIDQKSVEAMQKYELSKMNLFDDLSKRKLSHKELMMVDTNINIQNMESYFAVDKYAELYDALVRQWELQKGRKMEGYRPLSTAKGEYNRSPQEDDSEHAVMGLIQSLQDMTKPDNARLEAPIE